MPVFDRISQDIATIPNTPINSLSLWERARVRGF